MKLRLKTAIAVLLAGVVLAASLPAPTAPKLARRFIENGKSIDQIIVDGRPPKDFRARAVVVPKTNAAAGVVTLSNVPAFDWSYGCSATAAAMMMGYYDNTGFANMYAGPTNGGVCPMDNSSWGSGECPLSATHMGYDGRGIRGHVDDYWIAYNNNQSDPYVNNWTEHTHGDCTGDFMGTNQSKFDNVDGATTFYFYTDGTPLYDYTGSSTVRDGCHGMKLFVQSRGYSVASFDNFTQYIYGYDRNTIGFTFAQYQSEIDAGRPVLIQVEGHTMLGFGYDSETQTVYIHDTWDYQDHQMTWGGSYSGMLHYGVTVLRLDCAPSISGHPSSIAACLGQSATFTVTAGPTPLNYQWRKNSQPINGAIGASYAIPSASESDVGYYDCVVTNGCGSVTSNIATLTLNTPPSIWSHPVDQSAMTGTPATFSVGADGSGLNYQWQVSADGGSSYSNVNTGTGYTTATYTTSLLVPADNAKKFRCVVSGACPPSVTSATATLHVVVGTVLLWEGFESSFVDGAPVGWTKQFQSGTVDWLQNNGDHSTPGAAVGNYNAMLYAGGGGRQTYLVSPPMTFSACNSTAVLEFWHKQAASGPKQDTLTVCYRTSFGSAWNTLATYTSSITAWTKETITLTDLTSTYYIGFLGNAKGGNGVCIDEVKVTEPCCPGAIDTQPAPVACCAGSDASLSVGATGDGFTYQWRRNGASIADGPTGNGSTYAGTTSPTLTIHSAQPGDAASSADGFDCVVSNLCSTLTSDRVGLSVSSPPTITGHPSSLIVRVERIASFLVAANGDGTLTYQWRKDGTAIEGATSSSYSVASVALADAGSYDCVVSNNCGTTTSDAALLTVVEPSPAIADAKMLADGQPVALDAKAVTYSDTDCFYIEEDSRVCGIRVQKTSHGLATGDRADVVGALATNAHNEHFIAATSALSNGSFMVSPLGISGISVGGSDWNYNSATHAGQRGADLSAAGINNIGILVRVFGRLQHVETTTYTLDDGSGVQLQCIIKADTFVDPGWQYACVTGVASIYKLSASVFPPQILVRDISGF